MQTGTIHTTNQIADFRNLRYLGVNFEAAKAWVYGM